jgi:hypothetical protein
MNEIRGIFNERGLFTNEVLNIFGKKSNIQIRYHQTLIQIQAPYLI